MGVLFFIAFFIIAPFGALIIAALGDTVMLNSKLASARSRRTDLVEKLYVVTAVILVYVPASFISYYFVWKKMPQLSFGDSELLKVITLIVLFLLVAAGLRFIVYPVLFRQSLGSAQVMRNTTVSMKWFIVIPILVFIIAVILIIAVVFLNGLNNPYGRY